MGGLKEYGGRALRYLKKYGAASLYRKVRERRERNRAEASYEVWLAGELPDAKETRRQQETAFAFSPCISILVPAYETPEADLREMLDSVLNQSYGKLELMLADGSASDTVRRVVEDYAAQDARVRYQKLPQNLGISENTNAALKLASGDYIGLLDHDDFLLPGALFAIVKALNEKFVNGEAADAVYTDEDKYDPGTKRHFQPHFKPDFNPEYLRSNNYVCHFFVVKRELALAVGGFRSEFDGAQDHDFILRCTERANQVLHVPQVLYSWRLSAASTAGNPEHKLYAFEAGKRAVEAQLSRLRLPGKLLDTENYGFYRVQYAGLSGKLKNSFEKFHGQTGVKVVYYDKACNNSVIFFEKEDYVLFTCVRNARMNVDFWENLKACADRPDAGLACARVYDAAGRLKDDVRMAGVRDPFSPGLKGLKAGYTGYFHRAVLQQELAAPTSCVLVRRELLERLFGEQAAVSLPELGERLLAAGYHMYYEPWAVVYESRQ